MAVLGMPRSSRTCTLPLAAAASGSQPRGPGIHIHRVQRAAVLGVRAGQGRRGRGFCVLPPRLCTTRTRPASTARGRLLTRAGLDNGGGDNGNTRLVREPWLGFRCRPSDMVVL